MPISQGLMVAGGIGEGLREGVRTYKDFRQAADERRQKQIQQGLLALKEGANVNYNTGDVSLNEAGQARQTADIAQSGLLGATAAQGTRDLNADTDPNSPISMQITETAKDNASRLRGLGHENLAKSLETPGLSAHERATIMQSPDVKEALGAATIETKQAGQEKVANIHGQYGLAAAKARGAVAGAGQKRLLDAQTQKFAGDMQKDLDADASRAGNFGQISQKHIMAQAMRTLATTADGHIANLPAQQQEELALGMARMLTGGNVIASERVKALVPKSIIGDVQKVKSWLLNEPEGANQQAFTKLMLTTINREDDLALKQMNDIRIRRLGRHAQLKQRDPETYQDVLNRYGITAEEAANGAKAGLMKQAPAGILEEAAPGAAPANKAPIAPYTDPMKERRYQEWKAAQDKGSR